MNRLRRDPVGIGLALVLGLPVGLRAVEVANAYNRLGSYYAITGGFMFVGLIVTVIAVAALAAWRMGSASGDSKGGPRIAAFDGGIVAGAAIAAALGLG